MVDYKSERKSVKISSLEFRDKNPRKISPKDFDSLLKSIQEDPSFMSANPLQVNKIDKKMIVYGGNQRLKAVTHLGRDEVICMVTEIPEDLMIQRAFQDNTERGQRDYDVMSINFDLDTLLDLNLGNQSTLDLNKFDDTKDLDVNNEDDVPSIPDDAEMIIKEGDIFKLGKHIIMCGDSMKEDSVKKLLESRKDGVVTHCISDPPYGIAYNPDKHDMLKNDDVILDYTGIAKKYTDGFFCMWTGWQVVEQRILLIQKRFEKLTNKIIRHKGGGGQGDCLKTLAQDYEICLVNNRGNHINLPRENSVRYRNQEEQQEWLKKASAKDVRQAMEKLLTSETVLKVKKDLNTTYLHPTQKPVQINERIIEKFTNKGDYILDLFLGSGSNLLASEKTDRVMFGMELDPKFIQLIIMRYDSFTNGQGKIECVNRDLDISDILLG